MEDKKGGPIISKVFIVNDAFRHNYDDAKTFGVPVRVTVGNVHVFDTRVIWDIRAVMENYCVHDYVLLSGHALLCFYVLAEAFRRVGELNILVWGARDSRYEVLTLTRKFWEYLKPEEDLWQGEGSPEQP